MPYILAFFSTALQAIEPLFSMQAAFHTNGGCFVNNEFIDVYLVTLKEEVPAHMFVLQPEEVAAVRSVSIYMGDIIVHIFVCTY